jgi:hypothetical protein
MKVDDTASPFWNATDTDGDCSWCGIAWTDEEKNGDTRHECPPGFWKNKPISPARPESAEPRPLAEYLSKGYDFSTQEDIVRAMEMGRELFNAGRNLAAGELARLRQRITDLELELKNARR